MSEKCPTCKRELDQEEDREGHGGWCIKMSDGIWNCKCSKFDEIMDRLNKEDLQKDKNENKLA